MTDASQPGTPPPSGAWPPPEQPPPTWQAPAPEPGPAPGIAFAPHGSRLLAYIIDAIIVTIVIVVILVIGALILGAATGFTTFEGGQLTPERASALTLFLLFVLVAFVIGFAYFPWFWARGGQTPGMKPFNLYVVRDADGSPIGAGQAILRLIGLWVAGAVFYLGFIWVFIDARRRGWHDLIAGTCVIERRS